MKRNVNKLIKYDNYYHLRRKNTVMEGRFAGRTWKLAGIAKLVLQLGQQSRACISFRMFKNGFLPVKLDDFAVLAAAVRFCRTREI